MSEYYACMDAANIPALVDMKLPASRLGEAVARLDPPDTAIPASSDDPKARAPEWLDFLASERTITDADWACRQSKYDSLVTQLEPEIAEFASANAQEIQAAQNGWETITAKASALGFHGQRGSLDR